MICAVSSWWAAASRGALKAIREVPEERRKGVRLLCRAIGPETQKVLSEGLISASLALPMRITTEALIQTMIGSVQTQGPYAPMLRHIPFETVTPETL